MSATPPGPRQSSFEMRRAFDAVFAAAPPEASAPMEDMLAIALAGVPYAVRLSEVAGVFKGRRVAKLPGPLTDFLGVAGIQGRIVPVYDLRMLMGHAAQGAPGWLLLVVAPDPLGLAFDALAGQFRVGREQVAAAQDGRMHVSQAVTATGSLRHLLDLASVVAGIGRRVRPAIPAKER